MRLGTTHHQAQFALGFVIHKEFAGHRALIAQHIDQEAQRAQVVAQLVEHRLAFFFGYGAEEQALDCVTHVHHGLRCLIEAQHRQHAAHLTEATRDAGEHRCFTGGAEELVHRLLGIGQGRAQFIHHAAHGLVIADTAVQLFHPGLERLGVATGHHAIEACGQALSALAHVVMRHIELFK